MFYNIKKKGLDIMPCLLSHFYFAKDLISKLDTKYKEQANLSDPKIFLYSNFYDLAYFYKMFDYNNKEPFNLYDKMHKNYAANIIKEAIIYTKNNGFDKDNISFIYGLICHYTFDLLINPYTNYFKNIFYPQIQNNEFKIKKDLDFHLSYNKEGIHLGKINIAKRFKGSFVLNFSDYEIIKHINNKTTYVSRTFEYYHKAIKSFKKYLQKIVKDNFIKRIFFKLYDKFLNKNKSKLAFDYIYKKKYNFSKDILNTSKNNWYNDKLDYNTNQSFLELYNESLQKAVEYFDAAIKFLFYNNEKEFDKLFTKNNIK